MLFHVCDLALSCSVLGVALSSLSQGEQASHGTRGLRALDDAFCSDETLFARSQGATVDSAMAYNILALLAWGHPFTTGLRFAFTA